MARQLDLATRDALVERVRFYRDLGLTEFYRRPVDEALLTDNPDETQSLGAPSEPQMPRAPSFPLISAERMGDPSAQSASMEDQPIPPRKPFPTPPQVAAAVPASDRAAALQMIREEIGDCTRCALHKGRNKLVFADGDPNARLMFVGEGPGADEDAQGLPFVGRAGQLLNNMIAAMGLKREEVYIANVVKCRPPGNRTPEPEEANTCTPFLFRQIDVVRPQVLVALGATAATYLLGHRQPLAGLRGRVHAFRGTQLIVTYHPAFLLRDPRQKKEAWADLQIAMKELGLKPPSKG
ncbi:MAG TPA: uracil-DNA glycosylase [Terracidiphilus sp.]|nr:uracil-DNA glycosylase [Terracidiphilus sp.]